nr:leucine-rich repeat protein [Anaerocolumna cellulosilytica]
MTYNVTRIGGDAFVEAQGLTSIKLPDKIVFIGADAFRDCSSLVSINIPDGVTAIENSTFSGCSNLVSIYLPDKVSYIGNYAFTDCSKLTGINLPNSLKKIGSGAFSGCSSLTYVNIPEGITTIENGLFQDCIKLTWVSLPESITSIGSKAFYNCSRLKNVHLSDEITSIGEYAFYNCASLTSIKIPYKVTKIENRTFLLCSNLTKIRIQNKVTSIGDFAFYGCNSLINVNIPESVTSIGDFTFSNCESLRPLRIPESVISIGKGDFPYTGVLVYKNSFAETHFRKNHPEYYQIIKIPLKEMFFPEVVKNINIHDSLRLEPIYYPANSSEINSKVVWSSSDPQVVSVDADGIIRGLAAGEAVITAAMGNYLETCKIIVGGAVVNPTSIQFPSSRQDMIKGDSARLSVNFTPAETTNRAIKWTSSDNSVIIVDNGRIYAKNSGTATITAVSATGSVECKITVRNPLKEIYSDYNEVTLNQGEKKKIAISYDPMDTTDDKTISWSIEDSTIASIEHGVITAVKPGNTKVTAVVGSFTHSIPIRILAPIKSLLFAQNSVSLIAGQSRAVPLAIKPIETTDDIIITSSDETVATYSKGTITAKGRGRTIITATSGSLSATCVVTVSTDIKSIAISKKSLTLNIGVSSTLTVAYNPANPADDKTVTWASSDKSVATVDVKGKVTPVGTGKATITATVAGDKKAVSTVTVKLSVPTTVKAVSSGHNKAKISWKAVSGASGYEVYQALSKSGTYKKVKVTTAKAYTNTGLITGTPYYYKVRAYRYKGNKKVYGSFSAVVNVKPIPSAPSNVKLAKTGAGKINFTWSKVNGAFGYEIYRTSSKNSPYKRVKDTTSYHYINYGLTKGKTYYYKVRAYKMVGNKKVYSKFSKTFTIKM